MSRRRLRWLAAAVVVTAAAGGSAAFVLATDDSAKPVAEAPTETVAATVQDLVEKLTATGKLGNADQSTVTAGRDGLLTWLPSEKAVLKRGAVVARVNNVPIALLYGDLPFYRTLEYGVDDGPDVKQLKQNLAKLGMLPNGVTVDDEFTPGTRQAVKNLQEDLGLDETGKVEPGDFVIMPGPVKVGAAGKEPVSVGDPVGPGAALYEVGSTDREITVELAAADAQLVSKGDAATITLPDGSTTTATVSNVGATTTDEEGSPVVIATLKPDEPKVLPEGSGVPVSVELDAEVTDDVLTVPVIALVALAEGSYAVEVLDDDGTTRLVAVEPGKYADGVVEIDGDVAENDEVVVPS